MTETLLMLLKVAVVALIFAIGMGSTSADVTYLWRRPGLLLRSFLAMYVLVPLAAFLLVKTLPLTVGVKAALLVFAVSAGAPLLPRKLRRFGGDAYVFSLVVTSSLLAIVVVPTWVTLLGGHFGVSKELPPSVVAEAIAKAFLIPLAAGMAVRMVRPKTSERLADHLLAVAGVVLSLCGLALLVMHWDLMFEAGWLAMTALVALMLLAMAIGHGLGGPNPDDRTGLAIACATRHIGVAVLVATSFPGPRTAVLIAVYIIASAVVSIPYLRWRRRKPSASEGSESCAS